MLDPLYGYVDGQIVVFGGAIEKTIARNYTLISTDASNRLIWTRTWENDCWIPYTIPRCQVAPFRTRNASVVAINKDLYMFGGEIGPCVTNALWKLCRTKENKYSWTQVMAENENRSAQPSPRKCAAAWEFDDKLWAFGGYGMPFDLYIHDNKAIFRVVDGLYGRHNQLICFDPSTGKWNIPDTSGKVPHPQEHIYTAKVQDKVWAHNLVCNSMHVLDLRTLVWSSVMVFGPEKPWTRYHYTFTALSESQIVMHGGYGDCVTLKETWIFDTELWSWKQHMGSDHARCCHSAIQGSNNSVLIFGGKRSLWKDNDAQYNMLKDEYWIKLEPDTLRKLALKAVCKHVNVQRLDETRLPAHLLSQVKEKYLYDHTN